MQFYFYRNQDYWLSCQLMSVSTHLSLEASPDVNLWAKPSCSVHHTSDLRIYLNMWEPVGVTNPRVQFFFLNICSHTKFVHFLPLNVFSQHYSEMQNLLSVPTYENQSFLKTIVSSLFKFHLMKRNADIVGRFGRRKTITERAIEATTTLHEWKCPTHDKREGRAAINAWLECFEKLMTDAFWLDADHKDNQ